MEGDPRTLYGTLFMFLTVRKMVWTLPHSFPLALATVEYMSRWEGMRLQATRLLPDNIRMITSGMQFWGCEIEKEEEEGGGGLR